MANEQRRRKLRLMSAQTFESVIDEMSLAVLASIDYLKRQGDSQIIVRNGQLLSTQGEIYLYEFTSDRLQLLDEDIDIEVRIGNNSTNGKVAAVSDGTVQIEVEDNLGTSIAEAKLIVSSYFLLEQLNEKLATLKNSGTKHDIAEKLFGFQNSNTDFDMSYIVPTAKYALNEFQEEAVRLSLGSEVSYIWGPPGTGKTFTIARLVEGLLSKGLTALLISHTNAATDEALLDVVEHLEKTKDYNEGRFLREGRIINPILATKRVTIEKIIEEKAKPIIQEIRDRKAEHEQVLNKLAAHKSAEFMLGKIDSIIDEHDNLQAFLKNLKSEGESLIASIEQQKNSFNTVSLRISEFQQLGSFKKLFSGTSLEKLTAEKSLVRSNLETKKAQLQHVRNEYRESLNKLKHLSTQIKDEKAKLKNEGLLTDGEYKALNQIASELQEAEKSLQAELESLNDILIQDAKIIATTLTKSYQSKKVLSREYDCVIVDEASMAPLPALLAAAAIAKEKIILVGDFFQLPPIARYAPLEDDEQAAAKQNIVNLWLRRDIFAFSGITEAVTKGTGKPTQMQQLRVQRRMHPDISEIVNKLIYGKYGDYGLKNDQATFDYGIEKLGSEPLAGQHLGIYDTSTISSVPYKTDSGSVYNVPQALICIELAKRALKSGYENIGIISAYRAQVNLLQKIIGDSLSKTESEKIKADTVHKFQGGEQDLIIFDVTTSWARSMYNDGEAGGDDEKLINVAFSRAKSKLLLVGDVKKLERHDSTSLVKQTIEHIRTTSRPIISTTDLIRPLDLSDKTDVVLSKLHGASLEEVAKSGGLFDENDFYKAFLQDLISAEQEVIIISPFLSTRRYKELEFVFSNLKQKGVQIFVITRPSDENEGNLKEMSEQVIEKMEKLGIVVLPIAGYTHQKIAVIDRKVLYTGSLNILSQRESHEIMHRISGKKGLVAKQYMQFLKLDKNIGKIGENKLKHCEVCTEPGAWYWTAKSMYGMWTACLVGRHSPNKPPRPRVTRKERVKKRAGIRKKFSLNNDGIPICPIHNISTSFKKGRPPYDDFYGCPKYKECDFAVSVKKVRKAKSER